MMKERNKPLHVRQGIDLCLTAPLCHQLWWVRSDTAKSSCVCSALFIMFPESNTAPRITTWQRVLPLQSHQQKLLPGQNLQIKSLSSISHSILWQVGYYKSNDSSPVVHRSAYQETAASIAASEIWPVICQWAKQLKWNTSLLRDTPFDSTNTDALNKRG